MKELASRQQNKRNLVRTLNPLQVQNSSQQEYGLKPYGLLIRCVFEDRRNLENQFDYVVFFCRQIKT